MNRRDILKLFGGTAAIPAVKAIEQLKLEPGDALVLKFPNHLTCESVAHIKRAFERFKGVPLIILDGGADLQVLKKS